MDRNEVFNIDCMEYMRSIPDKAFSLAIADPPYGLPAASTQGAGKLRNRQLNMGNVRQWDVAPPQEFFDELFRVSRHQIIVYDENGKKLWDAVCHRGSYGYENGLLEIYGNIVDEKKDGDEVVGWLTADDVIARIERNNE